MRPLLRGFLTGFGFALGASVAGTLLGYTIGRIGEASVKRLLSPERKSSPASEPSDTDDLTDEEKIALMVKYGGATQEEAVAAVAGIEIDLHETGQHKSHYDAIKDPDTSRDHEL